jgi:hypothetical protein
MLSKTASAIASDPQTSGRASHLTAALVLGVRL